MPRIRPCLPMARSPLSNPLRQSPRQPPDHRDEHYVRRFREPGYLDQPPRVSQSLRGRISATFDVKNAIHPAILNEVTDDQSFPLR